MKQRLIAIGRQAGKELLAAASIVAAGVGLGYGFGIGVLIAAKLLLP